MLENINELTKAQIIEKYKELKKKKKYFEDDIDATKKALEDHLIDYVTKKEYENDITFDNFEINIETSAFKMSGMKAIASWKDIEEFSHSYSTSNTSV